MGESIHGDVARHVHPLSLEPQVDGISRDGGDDHTAPRQTRHLPVDICERARLPRLPRREETRARAATRARDASSRGRPLEPSLLPSVAVAFGLRDKHWTTTLDWTPCATGGRVARVTSPPRTTIAVAEVRNLRVGDASFGETPDAVVTEIAVADRRVMNDSTIFFCIFSMYNVFESCPVFSRCWTTSVHLLSPEPRNLKQDCSQPRKQKQKGRGTRRRRAVPVAAARSSRLSPPCSLTDRSSLIPRWAAQTRGRNETSGSPWRAPRYADACSPPRRGGGRAGPCRRA